MDQGLFNAGLKIKIGSVFAKLQLGKVGKQTRKFATILIRNPPNLGFLVYDCTTDIRALTLVGMFCVRERPTYTADQLSVVSQVV